MRITFPFESLTKIGFLRIYFFNLFGENLYSQTSLFEKFDTDNTIF
jgi:hypothetical protein